MDEWIELVGFSKPDNGRGKTVFINGQEVAIFCVDGALWAIDDSCPHAGASLGRSAVDGFTVQCPSHGMKFDLRTGCMPSVPTFGVRTHRVKESDGRFWIALAPT